MRTTVRSKIKRIIPFVQSRIDHIVHSICHERKPYSEKVSFIDNREYDNLFALSKNDWQEFKNQIRNLRNSMTNEELKKIGWTGNFYDLSLLMSNNNIPNEELRRLSKMARRKGKIIQLPKETQPVKFPTKFPRSNGYYA